MRRTHLTVLAALFAFVALVSVGCGKSKTKTSSSTSTTAAAGATAQGSINVADQTSDGTKLTIASVTITNAPNGGWIALHIDSGGKPGPVMGKVHIPAGSSQNLRDLAACNAAVSHRLVGLLVKVDKSMQDLVAFLPLWLQAIEKRRALLLRRAADAEEPNEPPASLLA